MIGGIVIEVIHLSNRVWVNCVDRKESCNDKCAIYVERNLDSDRISVGDSFWWQGGFAIWTPHNFNRNGKRGVDFEIRIPKIGFSGVGRPQRAKEQPK